MLSLLSENFLRFLGGKTSAWEATVVGFFPFPEQSAGCCCIPYSSRCCSLLVGAQLRH